MLRRWWSYWWRWKWDEAWGCDNSDDDENDEDDCVADDDKRDLTSSKADDHTGLLGSTYNWWKLSLKSRIEMFEKGKVMGRGSCRHYQYHCRHHHHQGRAVWGGCESCSCHGGGVPGEGRQIIALKLRLNQLSFRPSSSSTLVEKVAIWHKIR